MITSGEMYFLEWLMAQRVASKNLQAYWSGWYKDGLVLEFASSIL